ncbi:MAG TPA: DUF2807 domain-containing protein [Flavisolibacter sp.]|nr:DUF2807 domain-containing protein [Flavisolibacter sp.]
MKQKLFLFLLTAMTALSAGAQEKQLVISAGETKHLHIADNLRIVLVQSEADDISVRFDNSLADKISVKVSGEEVFLEAKPYLSSKPLIYVHVNGLSTLTAGENVDIETIGTLESKKIELFIHANSRAHLRTKGRILAYPTGDHSIVVKDVTPKVF